MSFGAGFARGLNDGMKLTDAYEKGKRRRELQGVADAKPTTVQQFDDPAQMEAMQNAINPETGKSYYDIQDNGQGGLQVRNNFEYAGKDGQTVAAGGVTQPWDRTQFMGKTYDTALTPEQITGLRTRAMADVEMKYDPARGMQLLQQAEQMDRDRTRFGWEGDREAHAARLRPMQEETAGLQLKGAQRTERQGERGDNMQSLLDRVAGMSDEDIDEQFPQLNTKAFSHLPMYDAGPAFGEDGKPNGYRTLRIVEGGKERFLSMSPAQRRQMFMAHSLTQGGFGAEGMEALYKVDKDIAALVDRHNNAVATTTTSHNDAFSKGDASDRGWRGLKIQQQQVDQQGAYYRDSVRARNEATERESWQLIGPAQNGRGLLQFNKNTGQTRTMSLPEGANANDIWTRITGNRGGQGLNPKELVPEGELRQIGSSLAVSDGLGNWIPADSRGRPVGVLPSQRDALLAQAGVPPAAMGMVQWANDGKGVMFNNAEYTPAQFGELVRDIKQAGVREIRDNETNKFLHSDFGYTGVQPSSWMDHLKFGPDVTFRNADGYPGNYNRDPEAWRRWRESQGR